MNKQELIHETASRSGATKKVTGIIVDSFIETIMESVSQGETVQIVGFGSFSPRLRKERTGRNPATGESVAIPAATVPTFKVGKKFKDEVKQ